MRTVSKITLMMAAVLLSACAVTPPKFDSDPEAQHLRTIAEATPGESLAWNLHRTGLKGRPWLGVDDEVRLRVERLEEEQPGSEAFATQARELLHWMCRLGREDLDVLASGDAQVHDALAAIQAQEHTLLETELQEPDRAETWLEEIEEALPRSEPHPGMFWRALSAAPAVPFIEAWILWHTMMDWRGQTWRQFDKATLYKPSTEKDAAVAARLADAGDDELLAYYAPMILQESAPTPDFRDDRIGRPELFPDAKGRPVARVDIRRPAVFGHVTHALVRGQWLTQLNYSFWYNDHPAKKSGDPEAGMVEGQLIRITLGQDNRPLVAESCAACGCYHRVYPVNALEAAARAQFGEPLTGAYSLARKVPWRIDPVLPELAGDFDPAQPHPLVSVRSGTHLVAAVTWEAPRRAADLSVRPLVLEPAWRLETLDWGGEKASLFGSDGLVRGADRPEATMLYPSGLYHAGTPRVHEMRKIHFDHYGYDDPLLLETLLRIPGAEGELR